jgi:hypothetical protein
MIRSTIPADTTALLALAEATGLFESAQIGELSEMLSDYYCAKWNRLSPKMVGGYCWSRLRGCRTSIGRDRSMTIVVMPLKPGYAIFTKRAMIRSFTARH